MNEWQNSKQRIVSYYKGLVSEFGHDPRACDYGHANSQRIKFDVLSNVLDMQQKSVLDVGCGFADYAGFLADRYSGLSYTGVDLSPDMIREAKQLRPDLDLKTFDILNEDIGRTYDVVTSNGIFYLLGDNAQQTMETLIARMYELSGSAVAFNSLSSWCDNKEPNEFYADPLRVLEFCRSLTPWVVLRHDYHPRDFTIYMYRERQA